MQPLLNAIAATRNAAASFVVLILAGCWCTSTLADQRIVSETIAEWNFGAAEDKRKDGWPDGWQRTTGQNFPRFIPITIAQSAKSSEELMDLEVTKRLASQLWLAYEHKKMPWQVIPEKTPAAVDHWLERTIANPYLRIQMDGGSAELLSPILPVDNNSVYYASALIQSDSPDFTARIKLMFLDANNKLLFETAVKPHNGKYDWQSVTTNAVYEADERTRFVQVVLNVSPKTHKAYKGNFGFDAIRVHRTPRLTLFVDKTTQTYRQGENVTVRCTATGMNIDQPSLTLKLVDHTGAEILSANKRVVREENEAKKYISNKSNSSPSTRPKYWDGHCEWVIPNLQPGYYEISTNLAHGSMSSIELMEHFAVLTKERSGGADIRFGWTMKETDGQTPSLANTFKTIESLREAHVGKVKIPIWFDNSSPSSVREFTERIDRIQTSGIQCVGVIASPPQSIRENFPRMESNETGTALEDPVLVQSLLEPVMRAMCVRLVEFQLGWDHEADFVSNPRFSKSLDTILKLSKRFGQDTQFIASHNLQHTLPKTQGIDRWQLYSQDDLTDDEMTLWLASSKPMEKNGRPPWFSISPLDTGKYSLAVRVQDLTARMLAVSTAMVGQTTAWISDPTSSDVGLLDKSGGPREMFVPFRSIAGALAGMRCVGSIPVPELGFNRLVVSADQARLIAWANQTSVAELYLGEKVQAHDVWGRTVEVKNTETSFGPVQRIEIGKWPVILEGIDPRVAQWRRGVNIVDRKIDPLRGGNQELQLQFSNPLASIATGSVTMVAPSIFAEPTTVALDVDPNGSETISIPYTLVPDASSSISPVRLDFRIGGDNPVRFSLSDELHVGSDDVEFNIEYQIDKDNRIWVTVEGINYRDEPVSFDCMLSVPMRPRERTQFANFKERTSQVFVFKNASELIGEILWLRCEQFGTRRVLNLQKKILPTEPE
ncbi:MAG: hypothetical protein ABL921_28155 [Pirellula sp.]